MRVLAIGNMYPPHHLGGYELAWQSAVGHLRGAGHEVRVLTTDYRDPGIPTDEEPDIHRELGWYWRDHAFPRLGLRERLALERANGAVLQRRLDGFAPDVVAWWAMGGMSLSLIERVRRAEIPAVGFVHDEWMVYGPRVDAWSRAFGRPRALAWAAERATGVPTRLELATAARWVFNSEAVRRNAHAARPGMADTAVAQPGVDRHRFGPAPERPWRGRLLYAGRIDPRKGIDTAIRALGRLAEATLTVCGAGDEGHLRALRELAAQEGLADRIRFERRDQRDLPAAYADADAVLFPVRWEEPWGLVPLEAMAVGTPVVATGTGGSGEYLRHGENCLIYRPPDDAHALAAAVARLAGDGELRRRLRERGLATAARYDERSFGAAVIEALERAAGR